MSEEKPLTERQEALLAFTNLFLGEDDKVTSFDSLSDCIAFEKFYERLSGSQLPPVQESGTAWFAALKRGRAVYDKLHGVMNGSAYDQKPDLTTLTRKQDRDQIERMLITMFGFALKVKKAEATEKIRALTKEHKAVIMSLVKSISAKKEGDKTEKTEQTTKSETKPEVSNEEIERLQKELAELKKENATLKTENEQLSKEVEALEQAKEQESVSESPTYVQRAAVKADMIPIEASISSKKQKLALFADIEEQLKILTGKVSEATDEAKRLEQALKDSECKGSDYTVLKERLEELKKDPRKEKIDKLVAEKKSLAKELKQLHTKKQTLQAKLGGQHGLAALAERKQFLQNLEATNIQRRNRAEVNLILHEKKMRQDIFQMEMRSFI